MPVFVFVWKIFAAPAEGKCIVCVRYLSYILIYQGQANCENVVAKLSLQLLPPTNKNSYHINKAMNF